MSEQSTSEQPDEQPAPTQPNQPNQPGQPAVPAPAPVTDPNAVPETVQPDTVPGPDPSLENTQSETRPQFPDLTPQPPQLPDPSVEQVNANHAEQADDELAAQRERDARQDDDVQEEETQ